MEELWMLPVWTSVRALTWSPTTSFSLIWRVVDEELVGRPHAEGSGQQLNVQMKTGGKWCPSGVHIGTSTV